MKNNLLIALDLIDFEEFKISFKPHYYEPQNRAEELLLKHFSDIPEGSDSPTVSLSLEELQEIQQFSAVSPTDYVLCFLETLVCRAFEARGIITDAQII